MTSPYRLTPAARSDLVEINAYIREDSGPRRAGAVRNELRLAMRKIASSPEIGHLREDLSDAPLRFWPVYKFLVVYRPDTQPLEIVRVLHGRRDVQAILGQEERDDRSRGART